MTEYTTDRARVLCGDSLHLLADLDPNSVDAVVTDPPYGLAFMGHRWDYSVPSVELWAQVRRVLKPGGHVLAFAGTRTQHRMAVNIEDAGLEIRDMLAWVYGSGFPKSLDVGKALDKAAGVEREVVGVHRRHGGGSAVSGSMSGPLGTGSELPLTAPATPAAQQWDGWGTALKPAMEPITMARKPLDGTVAQNVLDWGVGGLNVDGCRVPTGDDLARVNGSEATWGTYGGGANRAAQGLAAPGRWPANFIHDGSPEVLEGFPQSVTRANTVSDERTVSGAGYSLQLGRAGVRTPDNSYTDAGSAARFFYCAKASAADRGHGNNHPTVKPTDLMRYLCRMVTPPGGLILDPFCGSGTTGRAAMLEGFRFLGMELDPDHAALSRERIRAAMAERGL